MIPLRMWKEPEEKPEERIVRAEVCSFKIKVRFSDGMDKVLWRGSSMVHELPHPISPCHLIGLTESEARHAIITGVP